MILKGQIVKGIGGLYTVKTEDGFYNCKAKGKFRKEKIIPLVGDYVTITVHGTNDNTIDIIHTRKNKLIRPPVSNIDKLIIVVSVDKPLPNTAIIDKMTVLAEKNNITPIIVITKTDLSDYKELYNIYKSTGYKVFSYSDVEKTNLLEIVKEISGYTVAFTGNSGVGKSTLINALSGELNLPTGEISDKLGRGRHTTRQAEIFTVGDASIIDTAGFSSIDFINDNVLLAEEIQYYFNEFNDYINQCRFSGCSHMGDKGCKICEMVELGIISKSRYQSYQLIYNDLKNVKKWQL